MNEQKREQLSAYMDGEAGEMPSIADEIIRDDSLGPVWKRYHLISDVMRGYLPRHLDGELASRVAAAIKEEPAILAPTVRKRSAAILKPVAGLAIAASVATLAIFAVRHNQGDQYQAGQPEPAVAQQAPVQAVPVTARQVSADNTEPVYKPIPASSRLNSYLVNHNEYRSHTGMQGMLPYVRIVTYDKQE